MSALPEFESHPETGSASRTGHPRCIRATPSRAAHVVSGPRSLSAHARKHRAATVIERTHGHSLRKGKATGKEYRALLAVKHSVCCSVACYWLVDLGRLGRSVGASVRRAGGGSIDGGKRRSFGGVFDAAGAVNTEGLIVVDLTQLFE